MRQAMLRSGGLVWVAMMAAALAVESAAAQSPPKGDLSAYISPEFCAAVVIHPQRLAESPILAKLPKKADQSGPADMGAAMLALSQVPAAQKVNLMKLAEALAGNALRRIVVVVDPTPNEAGPVSGGVILQFDAELDGDVLFPAVVPDAQKKEIQGAACYTFKPEGPKEVTVAACARGKIVLVAPEATMKKMLTPASAVGPLLGQLRKTGLANDVIVEYAAQPLSKGLAAGGMSLEKLAQADPQVALATQIQAASVTLNLSGETLLAAQLAVKDEAAAAQMAAMLEGVKAMGQQQFEALKQQPMPMLPPQLSEQLFTVVGDLLGKTKVDKSRATVSLTIGMPKGLAELLEQAAQMAAMFQAGAGGMPPGMPGADPTSKPPAKGKPKK